MRNAGATQNETTSARESNSRPNWLVAFIRRATRPSRMSMIIATKIASAASVNRYTEAALAIFVAMIMDILDGRVARLMKATSQFGLEFDSLADVVSFCVAPAFLIYSFALSALGRPAWFGAFLFVICGALRLARFNVHTGTVDRRFFVGLPTPAAAGLVVSSVILLKGVELSAWLLLTIAVGTYVAAWLMVSTFRYWSFKEFDFARRRPLWTLLVMVLSVMIVATRHEVFLFLIFGGYAVSGPLRRLIVVGSPASLPADQV